MAVDSNKTFSPPEGVANAAKRALEWISEGFAGDGFTDVGRRRAVQLASGADVSGEVVNRMLSFFARQEKSVKGATGFNSGEEGYPTAGRVAWDAWGGDPGQTWVNSLEDDTRNSLDLILESASEMEDGQLEDYSMSKEELVLKVSYLKGEVLELVGKLAKTVDDLSELVESVEMPAPVMEEPTGLPSSMMEEDSLRFVDPNDVAELAKRGERVSKGIERRQILQGLEIRSEGDGMTLRGYAAVFNSASQPLPFTETIQPGAFRDSLKSRNDIKLLWNHDTSIVLGSTRAGTLRLMEDSHGLLLEADLPDTQAGRDAATLVKRGDVNAFSFGFRIPTGGDEWITADQRILKRINIHETSLVAFPAYTSTEGTASVRSLPELESMIAKLAELRGVSAEDLTSALLALEAGEELTESQGELLTDTLSKVLQKDPEVATPQALLDMKKKQLDLLMQKV
jgi:HK97 family phage prohead protease